jgi:hypothetical protein
VDEKEWKEQLGGGTVAYSTGEGGKVKRVRRRMRR